jgi:predicted amidohydrolase
VEIALIQQHASPDRAANVARALDAVDRAASQGASLAIFAELAFERFHPQRPASGSCLELA